MTTTDQVARLTSNGEPIPFSDTYFAPMVNSSKYMSDPSALRARLHRDGYLFLRAMLDREEILRLRAAYFSRLDPRFLKPGTRPAEGLYSGTVPTGTLPHGVPGHAAHDFVRSEEFRQFSASPSLRRLAEMLLEGPVQMLPRKIVRHFYQGSERASRAHTDLDYMTEGSDQVVTTWIPLGDCPLAMGGLVYLENTHTLTPEQLAPLRTVTDRRRDPRPISHNLQWTAQQLGRRWLWANYAAGDIAVHMPRIVHASMDTNTVEMRLSADLRFQRAGTRTDSRWTRDWSADDGA